MTKEKYLLSISSSADGAEINIHTNDEGLAELEKRIKSLRKQLKTGDCPHSHLMSESWGLSDLTETMLSTEKEAGCNQVHHVKLYGWTPKWQKKHDL